MQKFNVSITQFCSREYSVVANDFATAVTRKV